MTREDEFYARHMGRLRDAGFARLLLAPAVSVFLNPLNTLRTLSNCRVLLQGRWASYSGFSSAPAFLKLFYSVQANNLQRHGIDGTSATIGNGKHPMRSFWYQSMLATTMQHRLGGVVTVLCGMSGWVLTHLLWLTGNPENALRIGLTIFLATVSTNLFGNTFDRQNYNALGWSVFPVAFWAGISGQYWILAAALLLSAFLSITVTLMAAVVTVVVAVMRQDFALAIVVFPAALKFCWDLLGSKRQAIGNQKTSLHGLLGMIGAHRSTKYRRPLRLGYVALLASVLAAFPTTVYVTGATGRGFSPAELAVLAALPIAWFIVNQAHLIRLADVQSIMMLFLSVSAAVTIISPTVPLIVAFWLVNSNPLVAMVLFEFDLPWRKVLAHVPVVRPFDMQPYLDDIDEFLSPVKTGQRVWLAFSDPGFDYNKIFDGLSNLYQALSFRADANEIHALPDWYSVMENNYQGAPDIWGRNPDRVRAHMNAWNARYAVVYNLGAEYTDALWTHGGFRVVRKLSWEGLARAVPLTSLVPREGLEWWLIEQAHP